MAAPGPRACLVAVSTSSLPAAPCPRPPAAGAQQNRGTPPCPSLPRHAVEGRAEFREPCLSGSGSVQHLPGKMGKLADKASDGLALWGIFINKPSSLSPTTSAPGTGMTAPPRAGGGKPAKVGTAVRASPPARRLWSPEFPGLLWKPHPHPLGGLSLQSSQASTSFPVPSLGLRHLVWGRVVGGGGTERWGRSFGNRPGCSY